MITDFKKRVMDAYVCGDGWQNKTSQDIADELRSTSYLLPDEVTEYMLEHGFLLSYSSEEGKLMWRDRE